MESVSIFDLVACSLILFLGIKGILRGFVKELFGLIGLVGGIFIASRYAETVGNFIDLNFLHLENKASVYLIGFLITLTLFWIAALMIGSIISKLINLNGLGILDKLLGFVAGAAKVFLIFSIIVFVLSNIEIVRKNMEKFFDKSFIYPIFYEAGEYIVKLDKGQFSSDIIESLPGIDQSKDSNNTK